MNNVKMSLGVVEMALVIDVPIDSAGKPKAEHVTCKISEFRRIIFTHLCIFRLLPLHRRLNGAAQALTASTRHFWLPLLILLLVI